MANLVDIIEFVRPHTKDKNLYVTGVSNRLPEEKVTAKLHQVFSQFGLLYEVQVLGSGSQPLTSDDRYLSEHGHVTVCSNFRQGLYAFVKYYSALAASRAVDAINGKYMLDGRLLKVRFANRQKPIENNAQLGFQQCCELANHHFGFNGWTSQIVALKEDKNCEANVARFIAVVRLDIRQHDMHSEGVGVGEVAFTTQDPMSRITAYLRAKKIAFQRASEGAFRKLIIVVLPNGKTAVEVNCTAIEAQHYVTQEELKGTVKVTQVEDPAEVNNPEVNSEVTDESQDTLDLDYVNVQLLVDLQMDM
ncbi:RAD52 motif-containing protein 1-like [Acanthaster planci]|uniref:RAD52 motif-containing protein 1-like n=1 Tax=Acanthaster planci TaxID=133434 RepID=A0A8B7ZL55_ACAPL|nr:RAD52 motif-containing protein 1-like [Acanthaster planci]